MRDRERSLADADVCGVHFAHGQPLITARATGVIEMVTTRPTLAVRSMFIAAQHAGHGPQNPTMGETAVGIAAFEGSGASMLTIR